MIWVCSFEGEINFVWHFFLHIFAFQCIDMKLETFLIVINLIYIPERSDNIRNPEYVLKYSSEGYEKVLDRQIMVQYSILLNKQSAGNLYIWI